MKQESQETFGEFCHRARERFGGVNVERCICGAQWVYENAFDFFGHCENRDCSWNNKRQL
jgi:hypothetical protein